MPPNEQELADMLPVGGTALVMGAGRSGLALARFLLGRGIRVRISDERPASQLRDFVAGIPEEVELRLGEQGDSLLDGCAAVFASPGVPWDTRLLDRARAARMPVSSELDLFVRLCPAPIIGITGTNGKTSTTALTGQVLAEGERPVLMGGNIGETVLDRLEEVTERHLVVLELSSFQLESIAVPRLQVAACLNITPDHLDRHRTLEAYVAAKARAVEHLGPDDHAVLNGRDQRCAALAERTRGHVVWFDRHRPLPRMPVPGPHNLENALAAASIARLYGLSDEQIDRAVVAFKGVEHRLELVGEWGGVKWYNDSKATNPEAAEVGLGAFAGTPVVLIAGGYGSGFELDSWLARVRERASSVVLIGASAALLAERLHGHPSLHVAGELAKAVEAAATLARPGSAVLLSPGYKSFDQFQSFEDRGRQFKKLVRELNGS